MSSLSKIRADRLAKFFVYLDDLRDSGVTNMFGAGSYLRDKFHLDRVDASAVLSAWMESFDGETIAEVRARIAKGVAS